MTGDDQDFASPLRAAALATGNGGILTRRAAIAIDKASLEISLGIEPSLPLPPFGFGDWKIVGTHFAPDRKAIAVDLPMFVSNRAIPLARLIAPFILEAN
jgi:hypothetical protein